jgi:hypothetical protein
MRAARTGRNLLSDYLQPRTSSIRWRDWREPSDDGWRIESVLERSASSYEKSVLDSAFLNIEAHFERLEEDLKNLQALHATIAEDGQEVPSLDSIEASLTLLRELKNTRIGVESVVPAADGGVAIVLAPAGDARAYLQFLNDGERSLVLYDTSGAVRVEDLSIPTYLDLLVSHLKAKEFASA